MNQQVGIDERSQHKAWHPTGLIPMASVGPPTPKLKVKAHAAHERAGKVTNKPQRARDIDTCSVWEARATDMDLDSLFSLSQTR